MLCVIDLLLKILWSKLNMKPLFSPHKNSQLNLVCFVQMAFSYKTPHQSSQGLRSRLGSGSQPEKQECASHFTAQGCRDETQVRTRTSWDTKTEPAGLSLLEGIPFCRSCMVPGPNRSDQGLPSWKVETKIRLWWMEWAQDRPGRGETGGAALLESQVELQNSKDAVTPPSQPCSQLPHQQVRLSQPGKASCGRVKPEEG